MNQLPIFLNLAGMRVLLVGDGPAADAKRRLIEAAGGEVVRDANARLAFVALDDEGEARAAAQRLRAENMLVNVVDRPTLSDFTMPAIVDRAPVLLAIGTGGASAGLAKALRERLEALLPATLGGLARAIAAAKPKVATRHRDYAARRSFWDRLLAPEGALDGRIERDSVSLIELDSADPDDLSLRQLRALSRADVVVHGADVPEALLGRARRDARRIAGTVPEGGLQGHVVIVDWKRA